MTLLILHLLQLIGIIPYFLTIRRLLIIDAFDEINGMIVFMTILVGLTPILNLIAVILLIIGHYIISNNMTAKDILKKIFFVK